MKMLVSSLAVAALVAGVTPSMADSTSGAAGGAAAGAVGGAIIGGPVGAVIGGVAGAVGGAQVGALTDADKASIRTYVRERPRQDVDIDEPIVIGRPLPRQVTVYTFEGNPRLADYRYAYVNDQYLLIDRDGRVVGSIVN